MLRKRLSKDGKFVITGSIPSKSNMYRISGRRFIKSEKVREFETSTKVQLSQYNDLPAITGKFECTIDFYYQSVLCDIDGGLKAFLDVLQDQNIIRNDRDCIGLTIRKFVDKKNPRIIFSINEA